MKRSLSFALLVLHLLVFATGSARAGESAAAAVGPRVVAVATSAPTSVGTAAITRAAADRGHRYGGLDGAASSSVLALFVPSTSIVVGPAAFVGLRDWRSAAHVHGSLRRVVNVARGPPSRL